MNELYIKNVVGKGRGVFSKKDIKTGEIVESSPVFIISGTFSDYPEEHEYRLNGLKKITSDRTIMPQEIENYYFCWSGLTKNGKKDHCIALGYGSLYNSANPSNMRYEADEKNLNLLFIAVVDIPKDTELTINYSGIDGNNISEGNYWFENKKFIE
ncbi:SET domain-containing protein [archaeon]|nr:SET domain-containing protein [archaeon]NCQ50413.1 SET domain-containing protein [archaeon]